MRRTALAGLVAAAAAAGAARQERAAATPVTYVFVHGAWGGSWDWKKMAALMAARGHGAVRVQLTGLGERVHLVSPDISLSTHIDDVVNTLVWDDLRNVVLVGHSYGGMVITGAADRVPARVRHLVYVDAFLPEHGESMMDLMRPEMAALTKDARRSGLIVPPWFQRDAPPPKDVPQPLKTFTEKITLMSPPARGLPATYILTVEAGRGSDDFDRFAERARRRGFILKKMTADHVPERSAPEALAELLYAIP